jgi:hypothetical protein
MFIFVILSPGQRLRDSLIWEMTKLVQLGLMGRFVVIIPPQKLKENVRVVHEIKEKLGFLSDSMDTLNKATVMFYPRPDLSVDSMYNKYHELPPKEKLHHREVLPLENYESYLKKTVDKMWGTIDTFSFEEKYLHRSKEYADFDYELSPAYIQLFLRAYGRRWDE